MDLSYILGKVVDCKYGIQFVGWGLGHLTIEGIDKFDTIGDVIANTAHAIYKLGQNGDDDQDDRNDFVNDLLNILNRDIKHFKKMTSEYGRPNDDDYNEMKGEIKTIIDVTKKKIKKLFSSNHAEKKQLND